MLDAILRPLLAGSTKNRKPKFLSARHRVTRARGSKPLVKRGVLPLPPTTYRALAFVRNNLTLSSVERAWRNSAAELTGITIDQRTGPATTDPNQPPLQALQAPARPSTLRTNSENRPAS